MACRTPVVARLCMPPAAPMHRAANRRAATTERLPAARTPEQRRRPPTRIEKEWIASGAPLPVGLARGTESLKCRASGLPSRLKSSDQVRSSHDRKASPRAAFRSPEVDQPNRSEDVAPNPSTSTSCVNLTRGRSRTKDSLAQNPPTAKARVHGTNSKAAA
eukprot:scaffold10560_cov133-Isochrysis_galbana.AAC.25